MIIHNSVKYYKYKQLLERDPLYLIKSKLIVAAVLQLGGARALMRRHLLSLFQQPAVEKVHGDPGRPKRVTSDARDDPCRKGSPLDDPPRILPRHHRNVQTQEGAPRTGRFRSCTHRRSLVFFRCRARIYTARCGPPSADRRG